MYKYDIDILYWFNFINDFFKKKYERNLTQLETHKLLYIVYGHIYNIFKESLYEINFEAWQYGPVCRKIYEDPNKKSSTDVEFLLEDYKKCKSEDIEKFDKKDNNLKKEIEKILKELLVCDFDVFDWIILTHLTEPWKETILFSLIDKNELNEYWIKNSISSLIEKTKEKKEKINREKNVVF